MIPGMTEIRKGFSISLSMTKGIKCTLLATFLLLSVGPRLVMSQTSQTDSTFLRAKGKICFYENATLCEGLSWCCHDITTSECCSNANKRLYGFSASVDTPADVETHIFIYLTRGDQCTRLHDWNYGPYMCFMGENRFKFGSGKWRNIPNHIDEAELGIEKSCNKTVSTDTFQYKFITEDRRRASWVLPMASLAEADSDGPLRDLPAEEQVIWFKSRGATLEVEDHQTTPDPDYTPVPDNNKRSGSIGNPRP